MLKQRIITAIVLFAILFAAGIAPGMWPLALFFSIAAAGCLWEWQRLVLPSSAALFAPVAGVVALLGFVFLASVWLSPQSTAALFSGHAWLVPVVVLVALAWVLGAGTVVLQGNVQRQPASLALAIFGLLAVPVAWYVIIYFLLSRGVLFVVSLMALIWAADIAAYFSGKTFGKRKLAPKVSPGKTWEGALGGVVAAVLWLLASSYWPNTFGAGMMARFPVAVVVFLGIVLAALSIVGDLFESLLKRRAGVKDSSGLLPGHGGIYDRIDALLPVAPMAFLILEGWN